MVAHDRIGTSLSMAGKRIDSLWCHQSVHLGFIVGRSVTASAVDHKHAISGVHLHRNGENILDLTLKGCLACPSWCNPIYQRNAGKMQRIVGKPGVQSRERCRIREPLDIEVLLKYP